jgi:hypothetical protein
VVELAEPLEQVADLLLAAKIQRVALGVDGQIRERRVDALRIARGDDDRRALGRGELSCREADSRRSSEDDDPLGVEFQAWELLVRRGRTRCVTTTASRRGAVQRIVTSRKSLLRLPASSGSGLP